MDSSTTPVTDVGALFLERSRFLLLTEYRTKLRSAVAALPAEACWWRANDQSNSVGNLLLHLAGNIRQWIVSGVGQMPDTRQRSAEFAAREGQSASELLAQLEQALDDVDRVLQTLTASQLLEHRTIQGRSVTVFEAVLRVVEHFSHHLGQIILIAKLHAPGAIQFYEDAGGTAKPVWQRLIRKG